MIGQPEVVPSTPGASEPGDDNKIRSDANLNAILGDEGNCSMQHPAVFGAVRLLTIDRN